MTIDQLHKLPVGTETNYGKFAGIENRTVKGNTVPVATFTEPKYGANTGFPITATPFLHQIKLIE